MEEETKIPKKRGRKSTGGPSEPLECPYCHFYNTRTDMGRSLCWHKKHLRQHLRHCKALKNKSKEENPAPPSPPPSPNAFSVPDFYSCSIFAN